MGFDDNCKSSHGDPDVEERFAELAVFVPTRCTGIPCRMAPRELTAPFAAPADCPIHRILIEHPEVGLGAVAGESEPFCS